MPKATAKTGGGALLAIAAEWAIGKWVTPGGILTDTTGTLIKVAGGLAVAYFGKGELVKGMGVGLALNAGVKAATGKDIPATLGIAGVTPYYRINGTTSYQRDAQARMVEEFA